MYNKYKSFDLKTFKKEFESQNFQNAVDLVMYFEC